MEKHFTSNEIRMLNMECSLSHSKQKSVSFISLYEEGYCGSFDHISGFLNVILRTWQIRTTLRTVIRLNVVWFESGYSVLLFLTTSETAQFLL